jgi:protein SCO1/2
MVALLGHSAASAAEGPAFKAGTFSPPQQAPVFSLRGSDGTEVKPGRYLGKVVLIGFGYTSCPDVCPTTLATLAQARRKLGPSAADVQVIYVTVDPERDTVERMSKYLAAFDRTFIGGTGSAEQVAAAHKAYGVTAEKRRFGDDYAVSHSSSVYLIDRQGRLRALMPYGRSADDYAHDLNLLLQQ